MTTFAHRLAFPARTAGKPRVRDGAIRVVTLRATYDGWSVLDASGEEVFHGIGLAGRREALEFAHDHGVLVVLS
jgi:hypothetical protein